MKVSELSQKSAVPVPTIKFYIREGLLPAGTPTGKNQADYGAKHVERLSLICSLRDDAGLSLETIARALRAADTAREDFVIAAIDALERGKGPDVDEDAFKRALAAMLALAKKRRWKIQPEDISVRDAARAVVAIERGFPFGDESSFVVYADAVESIARHEIPDDWAPDESRDAALRFAVMGTVLFEPFILALRRMAHVARTRSITKQRRKRGK